MKTITRVVDAGGAIISLGDYDIDEDEVFYTGRVVQWHWHKMNRDITNRSINQIRTVIKRK